MLRAKITALLSHSGFERYLRNTLWLFSGQFLRLFIGLFVSVAVARYLGPGDFGLFNFIISILALLGVVAKLGLPNLLKREMVRFPEKRDRYMGIHFVLTGSAGNQVDSKHYEMTPFEGPWPALRQAALAGENFEMTAGTQVRDFSPVEDAARFFLDWCHNREIPAGEPVFVNYGSGAPRSLIEYAQEWWQDFGAKGKILAGALPSRPSEQRFITPLL